MPEFIGTELESGSSSDSDCNFFTQCYLTSVSYDLNNA